MENFGTRGSLELESELENFQDIASYIKPRPGDIPELRGFDIYGETWPLDGEVGGDHIIYLDFKKRYDLEARIALADEQGRTDVAEKLAACKTRAGIVLVDVSGHRITDASGKSRCPAYYPTGGKGSLNLGSRFRCLTAEAIRPTILPISDG